jgi:hypothetical protein
MFDLVRPEHAEIERDPLQGKILARLHERYGGDIVVAWHARFEDGLTGKPRDENWLFHTGFSDGRDLFPDTFTPIDNVVGGTLLRSRIRKYRESGPQQYILFGPGYDAAAICTNIERYCWVPSGGETWRLREFFFPCATNEMVWTDFTGRGYPSFQKENCKTTVRRVWHERDGKVLQGTLILEENGHYSGAEDSFVLRGVGDNHIRMEGRCLMALTNVPAVTVAKLVRSP